MGLQSGEGGEMSEQDYASVVELTGIEQHAASFVCYCKIILLTTVKFHMVIKGQTFTFNGFFIFPVLFS